MYVPDHFALVEQEAITRLIRENSFAVLISKCDPALSVSHLPFDLDDTGRLTAHVARANPHSDALTDGSEALVIFQGPHAYISPTWYAGKGNVPTWNYQAIHVTGTVKVIESEEAVLAVLSKLVARNEAGAAPWSVQENETLIKKMIPHILAFEIEITNVVAKEKMSQNKSAKDREAVVAALLATSGSGNTAVAQIMSDGIGD